jgi:hypothetical protein
MQQLQLGVFIAAATVLVVYSCIFTLKPTKSHDASGRSIALAVTLATLISIAPHEASAKGGYFTLHSAWSPISRAEAGTVTSSPPKATTTEPLSFGGCGGRRYRDPNTHQCRGPADFSR